MQVGFFFWQNPSVTELFAADLCIVLCMDKNKELIDAQVIRHAQAGDRKAFASLFEQYKNLVYKAAYLMLGNKDEAEDALQEVFVLIHRSLAGFDPRKGAFSTWLRRITFNYCLNQHRRRHASMLSLDDIPVVFASKFPGEQLAEKQIIDQAIFQLSDRQRAVVILRYYWDLPYAEISEVLEIPLGTVKSRLDLALKTLRQSLEKQAFRSDQPAEAEVYDEM
jgi:RNA polymerase sigma-70 factor, ECF subfamily